jgi:hypothetical protein
MRFELRRLTDYSEEAILDEIRRVAQLVQRPKLTRKEFRKHSRVHPSTVANHFGSWENALREAGLLHRFHLPNNYDTPRHRCRPLMASREEVVAELRRVSQVLERQTFTCAEFNATARFTGSVVRRIFGTFHKGMQAAGLATNAMGKRYTDEDCFENLLKVWTYYGRPPQHDEMRQPPSTVGSKAYIGRFGTWNRALHAFVDRANADIAQSEDPRPAETQVEVVKTRSTLSPADRRKVPLGLRWAVIVRDRCRCVLCGRSPATHLGVSLDADHIVPFSKGGRTIMENLRTLCDDCNLGKGSKLEGSMTGDKECGKEIRFSP